MRWSSATVGSSKLSPVEHPLKACSGKQENFWEPNVTLIHPTKVNSIELEPVIDLSARRCSGLRVPSSERFQPLINMIPGTIQT
jgi:hypothetical protein